MLKFGWLGLCSGKMARLYIVILVAIGLYLFIGAKYNHTGFRLIPNVFSL